MRKTAILLSLITLSLFAKEIPVHKAENIALKFMEKIKNKKLQIKPKRAYATPNFKGLENHDAPYYIFNLEGGGWVIVADDDINSPVLAYSKESSINPFNMPPQFRWWLKNVAKELRKAKKLAKEGKITKPAKAYAATPNSTNAPQKAYANIAVGPLLQTAWGQGRGYNEYCPRDPRSVEGNNHVPTGCVATAMAQIMNYFQWPPRGVGSNTYIPESNPQYGRLSANFAQTSYYWGSEDNKAKISYHAGVAVNMDYGPYGSGAYIHDANNALRYNFRYNTSGVIKKTNDAEWIQRLVNSLNHGSPVLYQGKGEIVHVFVCDGYQIINGEYMFHFNWGWSGRGDGWFKLGNLAPINSYTFNIKNYAIFDIYPNDPNYKLTTQQLKKPANIEIKKPANISFVSVGLLLILILFSVKRVNKKQ